MTKIVGKTLGWIWAVIAYFGIRLPLIILGFLVFPIAYKFRDVDDSLPKWAWLWDNEEDGIYGAPFWQRKYDNAFNFKQAYHWSALRNPANNLRFTWVGINRDDYGTVVPHTYAGNSGEIPHPRLARELGGTVWHLSYVKVFKVIWVPSFWYIRAWNEKKHFRVRFGWKCTSTWLLDDGLNKDTKYSGLALQFLPWRNG